MNRLQNDVDTITEISTCSIAHLSDNFFPCSSLSQFIRNSSLEENKYLCGDFLPLHSHSPKIHWLSLLECRTPFSHIDSASPLSLLLILQWHAQKPLSALSAPFFTTKRQTGRMLTQPRILKTFQKKIKLKNPAQVIFKSVFCIESALKIRCIIKIQRGDDIWKNCPPNCVGYRQGPL